MSAGERALDMVMGPLSWLLLIVGGLFGIALVCWQIWTLRPWSFVVVGAFGAWYLAAYIYARRNPEE